MAESTKDPCEKTNFSGPKTCIFGCSCTIASVFLRKEIGIDRDGSLNDIWILINLIEYQFCGYVGVEFINKRFALSNSVAINAHVDAG